MLPYLVEPESSRTIFCKVYKQISLAFWRRVFLESTCLLKWERSRVKVLANEDTLLRTHYCSWCFLGCANWETFVADTKCFWTKSETFFVSRTQNLCPRQMLRARANGETFESATLCPQQCVLICQYLKIWRRPCLLKCDEGRVYI